MKALVIAAHPDDEVLGCGGTIARLSREGHDIAIAILGEGITSRYAGREQADPSLLKELRNNAQKAANILGASRLITHQLPDNRFDTVPLLDIVKAVEELIAEISPQVIYTHHGGDLNIDHVIVNRAVITAARPLAACPVREMYSFEAPSSTEWTFGQTRPAFTPNVFVDISKSIAKKMIAMAAYEGEARRFPHPRSREALRSFAVRWGVVAGVEAAEAFELVRMSI